MEVATMTTREEYMQKLKVKLDEWDAEIDALQARAEVAQADARARYLKQMQEMRETRNEAMAKYQEMQDAAGDVWRSMGEAAEKTWQAWLDAFDQTRERFREDRKG
jgi:uncharacterized coiled-coil DUF342 family protein